MSPTRIFSIALLLAASPLSAPAQAPLIATVRGTVLDVRRRPVAGATVMLIGVQTGTITAADGRYTLLTPSGTVTIRVTAGGFMPSEVTGLRLFGGDKVVTQDFMLEALRPVARQVLPYPGFTADQVDDPVAYLSGPTPVFPPDLKAQKVEGHVTLRFVVGTDGLAEPSSFKVITSSNKAFEEPAMEAIRKSTFKPAKIKGEPVRQIVEQVVRFTIKPGQGAPPAQ